MCGETTTGTNVPEGPKNRCPLPFVQRQLICQWKLSQPFQFEQCVPLGDRRVRFLERHESRQMSRLSHSFRILSSQWSPA